MKKANICHNDLPWFLESFGWVNKWRIGDFIEIA